MSSRYAEAPQLSSVSQTHPGFRAVSQNIVAGRFIAQKFTDSLATSAPHARRRPGSAPERAHYALLNGIKQAQPNSAPGRAAQSYLAQDRIFARRTRSASVQRWRRARAATVINMAAQNPKLIKAVDPTHHLRDAINVDTRPSARRTGPRTPRPYDSMREGPRFTESRVVSLRELPEVLRPLKPALRVGIRTAVAAFAPAPA